MDVAQLKTHCGQFRGSVETLSGHPSNILVYSVGGKTFTYFKTSKPEQRRFSLRVTPDRFLELTDMPGVKPARYMDSFLDGIPRPIGVGPRVTGAPCTSCS